MPQANQQTEVLQMPMMTREAPITTVDAASRLVDLVWTTGAGVLRYDWYNDRYYEEVLSLDPKHVRMGRIQSGRAPLLNTHARWDLSAVMGVIRSASLAAAEGTGQVEFSKREDVEPFFQDVLDKIICNVSVGYTVYAFDRIPPSADGKPWTYMAIDWEPTEFSLVPIGADAEAGTRSNEAGKPPTPPTGRMSPCTFTTRAAVVPQPPAAAGNSQRKAVTMADHQQTDPAAPNTAASSPAVAPAARTVSEPDLAAARAEGARLEGERQTGIREAVRLGGLDEAFALTLIARSDMSPADAGLAVLREKAKRDAANPTRTAASIVTTSDETENRRAAMGDAIMLRVNPNALRGQAERVDAARQFRGMNLIDMAREAITAAGGSTAGMNRREIAVVALNLEADMRARAGMQSLSDFPNILAGTIGRSLRTAYDLQPRTFTGWARQTTAPDFREVARVQMSESTKFQKIGPGGEYKVVVFGDSAEKYSLSKYGGIVSFTWESLINDDLNAFDRIPTALAAEAAALEGDIVYKILTGNPKMSDNVTLFHAQHGNLVAAGALDDVSLGAGRTAMRKQTGMKGRVLNLTPSFLIVGPDNEGPANKYTSTNFVAAKAVDINPVYNTSLEVVVDPRIEGKDFFLSAAPALVDTIEYAYLEGEEGLFTETRQGFEVDGLQIKARHVFAAKAIDWRGLQKTPAP